MICLGGQSSSRNSGNCAALIPVNFVTGISEYSIKTVVFFRVFIYSEVFHMLFTLEL